MSSPVTQKGRVRFDWGLIGGRVISEDADIVVVVDVLSFTTSTFRSPSAAISPAIPPRVTVMPSSLAFGRRPFPPVTGPRRLPRDRAAP